jgi:EAL domain-containing protein (putative c-di-GMP-specific phosphodiesterase class I)
VVEVTESSFVEVDSAAERLAALGALGVHAAIDAFGTRYSSLSYLAQLPVHAVKVDRSFTNMVGATSREGQVARLVMQLASAVDLEAIVEGIETAEQLAEVRRIGCRFGQGFFIAHPMPAAVVRSFLATSESHRALSSLGADAAA